MPKLLYLTALLFWLNLGQAQNAPIPLGLSDSLAQAFLNLREPIIGCNSLRLDKDDAWFKLYNQNYQDWLHNEAFFGHIPYDSFFRLSRMALFDTYDAYMEKRRQDDEAAIKDQKRPPTGIYYTKRDTLFSHLIPRTHLAPNYWDYYYEYVNSVLAFELRTIPAISPNIAYGRFYYRDMFAIQTFCDSLAWRDDYLKIEAELTKQIKQRLVRENLPTGEELDIIALPMPFPDSTYASSGLDTLNFYIKNILINPRIAYCLTDKELKLLYLLQSLPAHLKTNRLGYYALYQQLLAHLYDAKQAWFSQYIVACWANMSDNGDRTNRGRKQWGFIPSFLQLQEANPDSLSFKITPVFISHQEKLHKNLSVLWFLVPREIIASTAVDQIYARPYSHHKGSYKDLVNRRNYERLLLAGSDIIPSFDNFNYQNFSKSFSFEGQVYEINYQVSRSLVNHLAYIPRIDAYYPYTAYPLSEGCAKSLKEAFKPLLNSLPKAKHAAFLAAFASSFEDAEWARVRQSGLFAEEILSGDLGHRIYYWQTFYLYNTLAHLLLNKRPNRRLAKRELRHHKAKRLEDYAVKQIETYYKLVEGESGSEAPKGRSYQIK